MSSIWGMTFIRKITVSLKRAFPFIAYYSNGYLTIKGKENELVKSMELMGESVPDTLVFKFQKQSIVDEFVFYSRDGESVVEKLKVSKILTMTCLTKK